MLTEERLRIARELHDVISHSIGTIGVQAGVARRVLDPAARAGPRCVALQTLPGCPLSGPGVVVPFLRELGEVRYQFERPLIMDSKDHKADIWRTTIAAPRSADCETDCWSTQQRIASALFGIHG